jgi:hypothetical protein
MPHDIPRSDDDDLILLIKSHTPGLLVIDM